uniref:RNA-directed RNA polymerase C-terminal domain-containing protein n=1 Tax=Riboviria sp. TaxID=2585031 RepID=A0A8K1U2U0_9VIRU|nr:MAG: hypothetical protein 1 [Riboviria sp.]
MMTTDQIGVSLFVDDDVNKWAKEQYVQSLQEIEMSSIPGACLLRQLGTTNGQVFKYDSETNTVCVERFTLVWNVVRDRISNLMEETTADPLYAFIKPEPHKVEKILEGRLRLIAGVSGIDSFVDRILFRELVKSMTNRLGRTPIAVGWTPVTGAQAFYSYLGHHDKWLSMDKSHWDWSVHPWLLDAVKRVLKNFVPMRPRWWSILVDRRFEALFNEPVWEFQDGTQIRQREPGIMKSGCYLTIWINSISQLIIHNYITVINNIPPYPIWALGDDTIQHLPDEYVSDYKDALVDLGYKVKCVESAIPEFCGFHILRYAHVPAYNHKHSFLLRHLTWNKEDAISTLRSYQLLYCNEKPILAKIRELARSRNLPQAIFKDEFMAMIQNQ